MQNLNYEYAIIGAGAAGLHLALAMCRDRYFKDKKILIVDKDPKTTNDHTWCFWEKGRGLWDDIIEQSWDEGKFFSSAGPVELNMKGYRYKMLRADAFYTHARAVIQAHGGFTWVQDEVSSVEETAAGVKIVCSAEQYMAGHAFDSRIDKAFYNTEDKYIRLLQHFKGWLIETDKPFFNTDEFWMMDFRLRWQDTTSFTYVLPVTDNLALVEFTLFTGSLLKDEDYDTMLNRYMTEILKPGPYRIREIEQGVIPMSDYPFHQHHTDKITKIGTAGGWVKPSTGYAFKNSERFSLQIIENIRKGYSPSKGIATRMHRNYDSLFIDILFNHNHRGEELFESMYHKNPAHLIFRFLDEEPNFAEDLKIMYTFEWLPFIKAIGKKGFRNFGR